MDELVFVQFQKASEERQEVTGIAALETSDRSGEVMDYAASKPHFLKWVKSQYEESGGKSLGNVRRMHQLDVVGKLIAFRPDDKKKRYIVTAKITDPRTWNDVKEGVLTGFSIGGKYVSRLGAKYAAQPFEVSVVDRPCMPGANFQYFRSDGQIELRKLHSSVKEFTDRPDSALPRQGEVGEQAEWGDLEAAEPFPCEDDLPQNERRSGVRQDDGGEDDKYLEDRDGAVVARAEADGLGGHLVTEGDGTKHLPTTKNGKPSHSHMGAAWAALHGGYRGNKYEGPNKEAAIAKLKRMYEREGMKLPGDSASKTVQGSFWDNRVEELIMELDKIENDLEKGAKKKASARLKEIRDMAKAHYAAMDGALDGLSKGIAGPDSPMTEGNAMQGRSGEMVDQARPAISFNPQEPTAIGKLAKALGVKEDALTKAVEAVNSGGNYIDREALQKTVQETVERTMGDMLERMFGRPQANDAVRGAGSETLSISKERDGARANAEKTDKLPPAPGTDPRMDEIYNAGRALKSVRPEEIDPGMELALAKVTR